MRFREVSSGEEKEPILHSISGLSPHDNGIVGYAGIGWDGKRKWYPNWYRSGQQLPLPDVAYEPPKEAPKATRELKEKGI